MKKHLSLVLVALAIITACICLVSCKSDELPMEAVLEELDKITFNDKAVVYNGRPKNLTVTTRLQYNRLPSGIKVRYEGNGNVNVGEYEVKAIFSRNGVEIPEATKTAKLTIRKASYTSDSDFIRSIENFKDTTLSYNGQVQKLSVNERHLPEGVSVTYEFPDGEPKVAGTYRITAKFSHTNEANYEKIDDQTIILTIEQKKFDTSGFSFNRTYSIFDGSKKTVKITGTLPEGLKVRYEPEDGVISVGEHTVRAVFYTDDENYKAPDPMVTTLTILNEDYSSTDDLDYTEIIENDQVVAYSIKGFKSEYTGNANYLILPDTHNGKPVTGIDKQAFDKEGFIYVYMPDTITTINNQAFEGCENLRELHISEGLTTLGARVFQDCIGLETINLPEAVTVINDRCFESCTSLTSVKLGSNVTTIGKSVFRYCSKLDKIFIPKSVQSIGEGATESTAPFRDTADNFMIVLEDSKVSEGFSEYWTRLNKDDENKLALVLYNQSYEQYITGHVELRKADKTIALAASINIGATTLADFDANKFEYKAFANIYYGYPTVSVVAASPAAVISVKQAVDNGGKAEITITSADGTDTKTYIVNFTTIGQFENSAEIVNKGGAAGAVAFVIDDGYHPTAEFAKTMLQKYPNLSLSFALKTKELATLQTELTEDEDEDGNKLSGYVMNEGRYVYETNTTEVEFWKNILSGVEGRADIVSHSHTHAPWGTNDAGGSYTYVANDGRVLTGNAPIGSSTKELLASKQIISELFPEMKNVGFIMPGIGVKTTDQNIDIDNDGDLDLIPTFNTYFKQILNESLEKNVYIGNRGTFSITSDYTNHVVTKDNIKALRANLPGLMVKKEDPVSSWTDYINKAASMNGLAIYCIHAIGDTDSTAQGSWVISEDSAEQLFAHAANSNVWAATYSDALLYYTEWASATATSKYISEQNKVEVIVTDKEDDDELFDLALTVKVAVPVNWEFAFDGTNELEVHTNANGSKYVYVDVVPDAGAVYLSKVVK